LLHAAGSVDRLLTYAAGRPLSDAQYAALDAEKNPAALGRTGPELLAGIVAAIDRALDVLKHTRADELDMPRGVGRKQLPSNVRGLLFHVAEHTQRHTGQVVTTARVLVGLTGQKS
jgi:uncharacterized damage-inducible protein DinB